MTSIKYLTGLVVLAVFTISSCQRPILKLNASAKLTEIQVSCERNLMPKMVFIPCEAVALFSDGSSHSVTYDATWGSSDAAVLEAAQLTHPSWVRGIGAGTANVTAKIGAVSGTYKITITSATPATLAVAPANKVIRAGVQQQYTSICVFSDSTYFDVTNSATWTSNDTSVASVATEFDSRALVTGKAIGTTSIKAVFEGITGTTPITVFQKTLLTVQVNPSAVTVIQGLTSNMTLKGINTDLSTDDLTTAATWSVIDATIASISNATGTFGKTTAIAAGTTKVLATYGEFNSSGDVTVINPTLNSITVTPSNSSVANGLQKQLTATGAYSDGNSADISEIVVWSSGNTGIASVSNVANQKGTVTGTGLGTTAITATKGAVSGNTNITVTAAVLTSIAITPASASVPLGTSQAFTATGTYSDSTTSNITTSVTWASQDTSKATISNSAGTNGQLSTVAQGSVTITATMSGVTGQTTITVAPPSLTSIAVTPANPSIAKGLTQQFVATGTYSDASTADISSSVTWSSNNTGIATISNTSGSRGLATGAGMGSTNIVATSGAISGQTGITVTAATLVSIAVTPANTTIVPIVQTIQYTATGTYTDSSTADITATVTWASSNTSTATISNAGGTKGQATGVGLGSTTISATLGAVSGSTQLTGI